MGCDVKNFRGVLPKAAVLALLCASLTIFASTAFAQEGTFVPTGSLGGPRQSHTATLLNNGTVLIAGGSTNTGDSGSRAVCLVRVGNYALEWLQLQQRDFV